MTLSLALRRLSLQLLVIGLVVAGTLLVGWWLVLSKKAPENKTEESPPAPVTAVAAKTRRIGEWTELLGTTQPLPGNIGRISASVDGRVVSLFGEGQGEVLKEGDRVKRGQTLIQLDDRIARANRDKLAATLGELGEQKKQAQFALELADIDVKRLEELRKGNVDLPLVSRVELAKAEINRKDAESKQLALNARETSLRAELRALDTQLDLYTLRAPLAGQVGMVQVMLGQPLAPGTTAAEVLNLDEIDILCFVPPRLVPHLELDQPARLAGSKTATGKVVYIALQAQPDTGNFAVKVRFPNKDMNLKANVVQRVQVRTEPEKDRLTIEEAALLEDQTPPGVVVAEEGTIKDEEGKEEKVLKARKLKAIIGVRDRKQHIVELISLEDSTGKEVAVDGLLFVTKGAQGLHDGDLLKLEEAEHEK